MKPKVYVDGQSGTTGLEIVSRLQGREDIELLLIDEAKRRDPGERQKLMEQADLVFLCLPDQAAIEAVSLCPETVKIIDTSTAHRTSWTYGFAELSSGLADEIAQANRVANPGCHATGMISLVYPLIQSGLLKKDAFLTVFSLTGYSGGGKKMIAQYEQEKSEDLLAPRVYGLSLNHKHIPEMMKLCSLETKPAFVPVVDDYYEGMLTTICLDPGLLTKKAGPEDLRALYQKWYGQSDMVSVAKTPDAGMLSANAMAGKDGLEIHVNGNEEQILLCAVFDNLGKGACGAAIQNMNRMLGLNPKSGLRL